LPIRIKPAWPLSTLLRLLAVWSILGSHAGEGNDDSKNTEGALRKNGVSYEVGIPPEVFAAQEIAAAQHVPGKEMAKVVRVKAAGQSEVTRFQDHL